MSDNKNTVVTPASPCANWNEAQLRQRVLVLEQAVQERNKTVQDLQRDLRVASSKARVADEYKAQNGVLRAQLEELQKKAGVSSPNISTQSTNGSASTTTSAGNNSSGAATASPESDVERLRRQLNEHGAPSPISPNGPVFDHHEHGDNHGLPPTEEEEIESVMAQAADAAAVEETRKRQEERDEEILRKKFEELLGKK